MFIYLRFIKIFIKFWRYFTLENLWNEFVFPRNYDLKIIIGFNGIIINESTSRSAILMTEYCLFGIKLSHWMVWCMKYLTHIYFWDKALL